MTRLKAVLAIGRLAEVGRWPFGRLAVAKRPSFKFWPAKKWPKYIHIKY